MTGAKRAGTAGIERENDGGESGNGGIESENDGIESENDSQKPPAR